MALSSKFLILAVIGLTPIALSYGLFPTLSLHFLFGIEADGRLLSLMIDGMSHWLLFVYLLLEVGFGVAGIFMLKQAQNEGIQ